MLLSEMVKAAERMERVNGIEPSYAAWEAAVLPLNYTRGAGDFTWVVGNTQHTVWGPMWITVRHFMRCTHRRYLTMEFRLAIGQLKLGILYAGQVDTRLLGSGQATISLDTMNPNLKRSFCYLTCLFPYPQHKHI